MSCEVAGRKAVASTGPRIGYGSGLDRGEQRVNGLDLGLSKVIPKLQQHVPHAGSQEFCRNRAARVYGLRLTTLTKGGHYDGALVNIGLRLPFASAHDEVRTADTNGNQRGVETKSLTRTLCCSARDSPSHAAVEPKTYKRLLNLHRVVLVIFDHKSAGGTHAHQRAVNKPDVHMPTFGCFHTIAGMDACTSAHGRGSSVGADDHRFAHSECDFPHSIDHTRPRMGWHHRTHHHCADQEPSACDCKRG